MESLDKGLAMPYVQRNAQGKIIGIFRNPQPGYATESVDDNDPEVLPPPPVDEADINDINPQIQTLALMIREYCNDLKAGTYNNKTLAELRADFRRLKAVVDANYVPKPPR